MIPLRDTVPSRSFSLVNWLLIASNLAIFVLLLSLGPRYETVVTTLGVVPIRFIHELGLGQMLTLLSSMFLHGGWVHVLSNMLALYIFGDNVEDRMGSLRYLAFYLLCGVAAGLAHVAFNSSSTVPTIGASGAISGVMAAYILLFPQARVITPIPVFFLPWLVEIPAFIYIGLWFASQLFNGVLSTVAGAEAFGGVAWWAHVGGFVVGIVLLPLFLASRRKSTAYADEYAPW